MLLDELGRVIGNFPRILPRVILGVEGFDDAEANLRAPPGETLMDLVGSVDGSDDDGAMALHRDLEAAGMEGEKRLSRLVAGALRADRHGSGVFLDDVDGLVDALGPFNRGFAVDGDEARGPDVSAHDGNAEVLGLGVYPLGILGISSPVKVCKKKITQDYLFILILI